jgi:hypothetical protein
MSYDPEPECPVCRSRRVQVDSELCRRCKISFDKARVQTVNGAIRWASARVRMFAK